MIWMPSWPTCAALSRSSTPFPNRIPLLAATAKGSSEPLGATVPVPNTQAPVEGGAVEVQNSTYICSAVNIMCKSRFFWEKETVVITLCSAFTYLESGFLIVTCRTFCRTFSLYFFLADLVTFGHVVQHTEWTDRHSL